MRELPVIFNDEMVRAILAGRKTVTRRPVVLSRALRESFGELGYYGFLEGKGHCFGEREYPDEGTVGVDCPLGEPGDLLWVRECWAPAYTYGGDYPCVVYRADSTGWIGSPTHPVALVRAGHYGLVTGDPDATASDDTRWRPSIHMPRWAARIFLRVTGVRVERVQDITEEDARAEGVEPLAHIDAEQVIAVDTQGRTHGTHPYTAAFASLWDSIYAPRDLGWDVNPWCWAVIFEVVEAGRG